MNYTIQKKYSLLLACDEDIDIYYESTTRNLYSNSKKEFFTYTTKILFALARLGNQGVSPRGLVCAWCCVKDCDCTVHEKTDLYSIFFKPDVYQNYELWVPLPEFNYSRHVFDNTQRWSPFIKRWFNLSDRVMEKVDLYSSENDFDPNGPFNEAQKQYNSNLKKGETDLLEQLVEQMESCQEFTTRQITIPQEGRNLFLQRLRDIQINIK
jgi:hypothetical protein